jgi:hypothetical protein
MNQVFPLVDREGQYIGKLMVPTNVEVEINKRSFWEGHSLNNPTGRFDYNPDTRLSAEMIIHRFGIFPSTKVWGAVEVVGIKLDVLEKMDGFIIFPCVEYLLKRMNMLAACPDPLAPEAKDVP